MTRVLIYDRDGKLLCWYSTPKEKDAESFCAGLPKALTWSMEYVLQE